MTSLVMALGCGSAVGPDEELGTPPDPPAPTGDGDTTTEPTPTANYPGPCRQERVRVSDGALVYAEDRAYTDFGRLLTRDIDEQSADGTRGVADGIPDRRMTYIYNIDNKISGQVQDLDMDGTLNWTRVWNRDADGVLIDIVSDWDNDGMDNVRHTYFYDQFGFVELVEEDFLDGVVINNESFVVDEVGRTLRQDYDKGADGPIDRRLTQTYETFEDTRKRVIERRWDQEEVSIVTGLWALQQLPVDNEPDLIEHRIYDPDDGKLIQVNWSEGGGTQIDVREVFTYECD